MYGHICRHSTADMFTNLTARYGEIALGPQTSVVKNHAVAHSHTVPPSQYLAFPISFGLRIILAPQSVRWRWTTRARRPRRTGMAHVAPMPKRHRWWTWICIAYFMSRERPSCRHLAGVAMCLGSSVGGCACAMQLVARLRLIRVLACALNRPLCMPRGLVA